MITHFFSHPVLERSLFGNTLSAYIDAIVLFLVISIAFHIVAAIIVRILRQLAERTVTKIDDTLIEIVCSIRPPIYYFLALYLAANTLQLPAVLLKALTVILIVTLVYQVIMSVQILIDSIADQMLSREHDQHMQSAVHLLGSILKGILWVVGVLLILSNLGVNITSLIAGVGIGGIAIAFALQGVLEDLFSSFSIYFDKPFKVGDLITVDGKTGTVKKIGIKTTRLAALGGEEVIIANKELTSAVVENLKRMDERRVRFSIGVTYETPTEKLKQIAPMITEIFGQTEGVRLARVHFKSFDDWALIFEVVYYVESQDFIRYMDAQQVVNFAIREAFEREGIDMAYPTQTVHLQKAE